MNSCQIFFLTILSTLTGLLAAMEAPLPRGIIEDYSRPEVLPIIRPERPTIHFMENYVPSHSRFETLPLEIQKLIAQVPGNSIDEVAARMRAIFNSSPALKRHLSSLSVNQELIKKLADRFYNSQSTESLVQAAVALDTDGAREFLMQQKEFLFEAIRRSNNPRFANLARAIIASGFPVNIMDNDGKTALMLAFINPFGNDPFIDVDLAKLLLAKGARTKFRVPRPQEIGYMTEYILNTYKDAFNSNKTPANQKKLNNIMELHKLIQSSNI